MASMNQGSGLSSADSGGLQRAAVFPTDLPEDDSRAGGQAPAGTTGDAATGNEGDAAGLGGPAPEAQPDVFPSATDGESLLNRNLPVFSIPLSQRIPVETEPCPVCHGRTAQPLYNLAGSRFRMVQCDGCGLGAVHPRPDSAEIRAFYPASYYGGEGAKFMPPVERILRFFARRRARWLLRGLPDQARVLDVGCGRGLLLQAMARAGCEAHGVERSAQAAEGLEGGIRLCIRERLGEAAYPAEHFDLVVLWHVLEHLPDPRGTLEEVRRILKPTGRLALAVPCLSSLQAKLFGPAWFHLDLPRHLFHFPLSALLRLLDDCGYDLEYERHFSLSQNPFGWVQSVWNAWFPLDRNALYSLMQKGSASDSGRLSRTRRVLMTLACGLGLPLGVLFSLLEAANGIGGTVCVTARQGDSATR